MDKIIEMLNECGGKAEFTPPVKIQKSPHSWPLKIKRCELQDGLVFYEDEVGNRTQLNKDNADVINSIGLRLYGMKLDRQKKS